MVRPQNILALDVGGARIGLAIGNTIAKMPSPLQILENNQDVLSRIGEVIKEQEIKAVIVGLPRDMQGLETEQTSVIRHFADELQKHIEPKIVFVDESLSTKRAESTQYAKARPPKSHLDDVAACFILEEYFSQDISENG